MSEMTEVTAGQAEGTVYMREGTYNFGPTSRPSEHVYTAIAAVMLRLSKEGIGKDRKNEQQHYKFRGIDDVFNALARLLPEAKLLMLPRVLSRTVTERETRSGGALFYVVLDVEFDLISAVDGSRHTIRVCGEAMDSADKATNKAMSAAYKYAALQAFCIPTEGDNDADATTHEVKAGKASGRNSSSQKDSGPSPQSVADRFIEAHKVGIDQAIYDVHFETICDHELYTAAWKLIPANVRRDIKDAITRAQAEQPKTLPNGRAA